MTKETKDDQEILLLKDDIRVRLSNYKVLKKLVI